MIPVTPQPEPEDFHKLVRIPGKKFLKKCSGSQITSKEWRGHSYWRDVSLPLYYAYNCVCAYTAQWIPISSVPNVDHFIPKSVKPELAYEWSNYRLAFSRANTLKREFQDVLDPFTISEGWFLIDFPSLLIKPNTDLPVDDQRKVRATIERLQLNEFQPIVDERNEWLKQYCLNKMSFSALEKYSPFIAYELKRQNLVEEIKDIMSYETSQLE